MAGTSSTHLSGLVAGQTVHTVTSFRLESGRVLTQVPVAYKTWGKLNERRDNVMVICHAFTGSADVEDWWGPLMGPGKSFDMTRFFIICLNVMGSPYGSASPLTTDPETGAPYGPEFPATTVRDDIRLHKMVLDDLGIASIAVIIGGSMGGMAVLEWPLCTPPGYVKHIIPIATSARHSAWCISWGEAQRQSIYSDPAYMDGYYDLENGQPKVGLAAARMAALLTYRSRDSFESRFGRKAQVKNEANSARNVLTPPDSPRRTPAADEAFAMHNDGLRQCNGVRARATPAPLNLPDGSATSSNPSTPKAENSPPPKPRNIFSAQSYLRYQGDKFTARFDANCYIHITRKLDTHDVARGRSRQEVGGDALFTENEWGNEAHSDDLAAVLATLPKGALVISVQTDGLFTPSEQREIAAHIPDARLVTIVSPDGHDGFLLEFEQINQHILSFLNERLPEVYKGDALVEDKAGDGFEIKKTSMFGEAEVDVTRW